MSTSNLKRTAFITFIIAVVSLSITIVIGVGSGAFQTIAGRTTTSGSYREYRFDPPEKGSYIITDNGIQNPMLIRKSTEIRESVAMFQIDEQEIKLMADVHLITAKSSREKIRINERSGKAAVIRLHGTATIKKPHLMISQNKGVMIISVERKYSSFAYTSDDNIILDIELPKKYTGKLSIESISGSIDLGSHDYDGVTLKTTSGSISIENMNTPEFNSETVSGSLYAKALLTGRSQISSTSGGINIGAFTGDANVNSVSGTVGITYTAVPGNLSAGTTSGNIIVELPNFAKFQLDASSTSGDVMCGFPITIANPHSNSGNHSIVGIVSNGKGQIRLHSVSGGIAVNRGE